MSIRILVKVVLGLAAVLWFSTSAQAGLTICNRFDRAISVAFALVSHPPDNPAKKNANFWGWYGVAAGECRRIRDLYGDNTAKEVTLGFVQIEDGMVKNSDRTMYQAMYLFARDDQGHVWDGRSSRVSSMRQGEVVGDRRDASGYVWPNTLNICSPTGHGDPNVASVEAFNSDIPCDQGRVSYFLINPRYAVEFKLEVK